MQWMLHFGHNNLIHIITDGKLKRFFPDCFRNERLMNKARGL